MQIDANTSFIHFVYPFFFEAETFETRAKAVQGAQWQRDEQSPLPVWQTARFPEDELLAPVARYLNPSEGIPATAQLWKLHDAMDNVYGLAERADWWLLHQREEIPFRFGEVGAGRFAVQLALFCTGVGFLTVNARPLGGEVSEWLDFMHYFRFLRRQRDASLRAQRRTGFDPKTRTPQVEAFFPAPAGGVASHTCSNRVFGEVLDALLRTATQAGETEPWWQEVFLPGQLLPFAVLYVDDIPPDEIPALLYKVRNFFHAGQGENPAPDDLRLDHPTLLSYAERQWFVFSLNSGAFVACNTLKLEETHFFRETLPRHLRDEYFILLLLALHQRFALMGLSEAVARHWLVNGEARSEEDRAVAFARIRDGLLSFMARGHFTQVMQREHHHRCYRKWQETFQVAELYQEVQHEVREMHDYLLMRQTARIQELQEEQQRQMKVEAREEAARERAAQERAQRLEGRISKLGVGFGVPALILSFLGINLAGITTGDGLSLWLAVLIGIAGGSVGSGFVLWLLRREPERQHGETGGTGH